MKGKGVQVVEIVCKLSIHWGPFVSVKGTWNEFSWFGDIKARNGDVPYIKSDFWGYAAHSL